MFVLVGMSVLILSWMGSHLYPINIDVDIGTCEDDLSLLAYMDKGSRIKVGDLVMP